MRGSPSVKVYDVSAAQGVWCVDCWIALSLKALSDRGGTLRAQIFHPYIIKIKIRSSCEIENFVETHLCKLCVILRSRALRVVCPH